MDIVSLKSPIEISGLNDDKPYIELTTRLCYLDYANLNGIGIASSATDSFETLKTMPVVAKINATGTKFGSHEVSIDDKGEIKFNTHAYGVHTEVWVKDDEVDIPNIGVATVPCLFAKSKIWKRFSSVVSLISNKFADPDKYNGGLWSSWELQGSKFHMNERNEKIYDEFTFLSNCLIDVPPAYSTTSKSLEVASGNFDLELSEAYMNDLHRQSTINENDSTPKEEQTLQNETSALTVRDLYQKVSETLNPKGWSSNPYYSVWEIYPEEHKILAYDIDRSSDDEYLVFTYSVAEDTLTLGEAVQTKLSKIIAEKTNVNINLDLSEAAKMISVKEQEISSLHNENETLSSELNEKTDALVLASTKIESLETTIAELTPYKEKVEAIEQAEAEERLAAQKAELKNFAKSSGLITEEELETSDEIKSFIDSNDKNGIKALIADRFMKKLNEPQEEEHVHTSNHNTETVKININNEEESIMDHKAVMSTFLTK